MYILEYKVWLYNVSNIISTKEWFGTCAHGILQVAIVQLPLSEQEEVICLCSSPGIVHNAIVCRCCIFLQQASKCMRCLITDKDTHNDMNTNLCTQTDDVFPHKHKNDSFLWNTSQIIYSNSYSRKMSNALERFGIVRVYMVYLRLLSFAFALLWRLHLLVVIFH